MANQQVICTVCGNIGKPKKFTKGSMLMEIFCWLLLLFPGLLYSVWRLTTRQNVCSKCGSPNIVPTSSPVGAELVKKYHPTTETSNGK